MDNKQMPGKGSVGHISIILTLNDNVTRELAQLKCHVLFRKDRRCYFTPFIYHYSDKIHCPELKAY